MKGILASMQSEKTVKNLPLCRHQKEDPSEVGDGEKDDVN